MKNAKDLIPKSVEVRQAAPRKKRRATNLDDFVVEGSIGQRSDGADEMKKMLFRNYRCNIGRV